MQRCDPKDKLLRYKFEFLGAEYWLSRGQVAEACADTQQPAQSSGQADKSSTWKGQSQYIDAQDKTGTQQLRQESKGADQHSAHTRGRAAQDGSAAGPALPPNDGDDGNRKGMVPHDQTLTCGATANVLQERSWKTETVKQNRMRTQGL